MMVMMVIMIIIIKKRKRKRKEDTEHICRDRYRLPPNLNPSFIQDRWETYACDIGCCSMWQLWKMHRRMS